MGDGGRSTWNTHTNTGKQHFNRMASFHDTLAAAVNLTIQYYL